VRRVNPPLSPADLANVLRCIRALAARSGLSPSECLALLEEAAGPLKQSDRDQIVAALAPAQSRPEQIH
jgi:hypothetical protein